MRSLILTAVLAGSLLAAGAASANGVTVSGITTTKGFLDQGTLTAGANLLNNGPFDSVSDLSHDGPTAYILDEGFNQAGDQTYLLHFDEAGTARNLAEVAGSFIFDLSPGDGLINVFSTSADLIASDDLSNGVHYQRCILCLSAGATIFRGLEPTQTPLVGDYINITQLVGNPLVYTVNYDFKNDGATMDEVRFVFDPKANAVPEPASWALMIGGFGMAGAMLRRRQTQAAAA